MNKKNIFFLSFLLMVSFSAGVFIQFLASDPVSLSAEDVSFWQGLWSGCKSDLALIAFSLVLSTTFYAFPVILLLVNGQVFTLGFTAAYLLSTHPQGFPVICAVLLPRCLIKLPACMALLLLSLENIKSRRKQKQQWPVWQLYAVLAVVMMLSSLLEAVLHLLIVSP